MSTDTAAENTNAQTMQFEAEVSQILKLMIHSMYSNKEIFLRELISNGSDACDKLRFEALADDTLYGGESELALSVTFDSDAKTLTIADTGIGMSREEVISNIGTIARSGTRQFLESMTGDQAQDAQLIGQFGVGFYSAFVVADKVALTTRRAGEDEDAATRWESDGTGSYSLETVSKSERGTEIVLHLRDDMDEFLNDWRLRSVIKKYSDHITFPVKMLKAAGEDDDEKTVEWETVNAASAMWTRAKSEISDDEYKEFYKQVCHDYQDPMVWSHNRVEGKYEYTSLLYIPSRAPFDLYEREQLHGIKLYVQRVFIMDDMEKMMPRYLRFVRGLIDSNDLPLNVSREILQSNKVIDSIRNASVKKVLGLLESMASDNEEQYQTFWDEFGRVIKEGPGEDFANREQLLKLMRFASTQGDGDKQHVSLADYVARMKSGQDKIYYITTDSFAAAKNSPHLEVFTKKGLEVLLMSDRVDEWMMSQLQEFDGKQFVSIAKGDLDLGDFEDKEEKKAQKEVEEKSKDLVKKIADALGDQVEEVRVSHRLTTSPACLVMAQHDMALHMQQLMKQAGHELPSTKPSLEVNAEHPILQRLDAESDTATLGEWSQLLFDQALLAEGGQLEDPAGFVSRLNSILLTLSGDAPAQQSADDSELAADADSASDAQTDEG
ncbi:MAG: molecular chaperone HtpG [Pseudomonadota bacterium]